MHLIIVRELTWIIKENNQNLNLQKSRKVFCYLKNDDVWLDILIWSWNFILFLDSFSFLNFVYQEYFYAGKLLFPLFFACKLEIYCIAFNLTFQLIIFCLFFFLFLLIYFVFFSLFLSFLPPSLYINIPNILHS